MDPLNLSKSEAIEPESVQGLERPPTLREFLKDARKSMPDWTGKQDYPSQEDMARRAGLTISYYGKLETGERSAPDRSVLDNLATALELNPATKEHMLRLAGMGVVQDLRNPEELKQSLDPIMMDTIHRLDDHYVAVFDTRWNLLVSNEKYRRAFPGLAESGNVLLWYFRSALSRHVLVEWEREAELNVYWFRYLMGSYGNTPWGLQMLNELSKNPQFREYWAHEAKIVQGRAEEDSAVRMRDAETGELWTLRVSQLTIRNSVGEFINFVGKREMYSGPLP